MIAAWILFIVFSLIFLLLFVEYVNNGLNDSEILALLLSVFVIAITAQNIFG